ncbi:MAG: hypothetical protein VX237_02815, partial [Chloroflexota bacterium]|nr:hypothetical protein [Chloroflexota bacterium]
YVADANNHRIRKIVISTGVVTTLAGSSYGFTNATGTSAKFYTPMGITTDGTNLYVADFNNHRIRKINLRGTEATDFAMYNLDDDLNVTVNVASSNTAEGTVSPSTLTFTPNNWQTNQAVTVTGVDDNTADGHKEYGISLSSSGRETDDPLVTTFAGSGSEGSTNATGTSASFNTPYQMASDGTNFYVTDSGNNKIRKIVISTGEVTTLASGFNVPKGIVIVGANLYVADTNNHRIRKIVISSGAVSTLAGSGSATFADGTGTNASFYWPFGITTDGTNLYVADSENKRIRKIVISTGVVTTLAGSGSVGSVDGTGTSASFNKLGGITIDGTNLYVVDRNNNKIRKIGISTGVVTTFAGPAAGSTTSGSTNGTGTTARFNQPFGITSDGINLYVADHSNHKIRKIVISTGVVTTLAGTGSSGSTDGTGTSAKFYRPAGITIDGTNLYVADRYNHRI